MTPWTPVPLALSDDVRVRALSLAAQLLLIRLYLHAAHDRASVITDNLTPEQVAVAVLGPEGRAAGPELAATSLVRVDGGRWWLAITTGGSGWGEPVALDARPLPAPAPGAVQDVAPEAPARVGSRSPDDLRRARYHFTRRARQWRHVPAGVSWEQWLASPDGVAWDAGTVATVPTGDAGTVGDASRGDAGTVAGTVGDAPGTVPFPPSDSPSSPREEEKRETESKTPGTAGRVPCGDGGTVGTGTASQPKASRVPPDDGPRGVPAEEVEQALYEASGGALRLTAAPSTQGAAIVRYLRKAGLTRAEMPYLIDTLRSPGPMWAWVANYTLTAAWLVGKPHPESHEHECARLQEAIIEARRRHALAKTEAAEKAQRDARVAEAASRPPMTLADREAMVANLRASLARRNAS